MPSILDPLVDKAAGVRKGTRWYQQAIASIADKISARRLMTQGKLNGTPSVGRLNMFFYDPKYKKTLPYYDTFPLVLPIDRIPGGFVGINLYYLRPGARFTLLERLQKFSTKGAEITSRNSFDVSYDRVKNIPLVKNTIKKYLFNHVRSRFLRIDYDKAALSVYLPVAQFKKGSPY